VRLPQRGVGRLSDQLATFCGTGQASAASTFARHCPHTSHLPALSLKIAGSPQFMHFGVDTRGSLHWSFGSMRRPQDWSLRFMVAFEDVCEVEPVLSQPLACLSGSSSLCGQIGGSQLLHQNAQLGGPPWVGESFSPAPSAVSVTAVTGLSGSSRSATIDEAADQMDALLLSANTKQKCRHETSDLPGILEPAVRLELTTC